MSAYRTIATGVEADIATITLNDPSTLNAATLDMAAELMDALTALSGQARAIILTGAGRGFCSGANLQGPLGAPRAEAAAKPDAGRSLETHFNPLVSMIRDLPVPFVTAVNGPAAGIGCSLALMGDIIVASKSAYFLQAFRRIGLVPDGGSTYLLTRMVGRARAMEMTLLGEKLPAETAFAWGLVNRLVEPEALIPTARSLAGELAAGPRSLSLIRRLIWQAEDAGWQEQLDAERHAQSEAGASADFAEGVRAFLEKRPARFSGR